MSSRKKTNRTSALRKDNKARPAQNTIEPAHRRSKTKIFEKNNYRAEIIYNSKTHKEQRVTSEQEAAGYQFSTTVARIVPETKVSREISSKNKPRHKFLTTVTRAKPEAIPRQACGKLGQPFRRACFRRRHALFIAKHGTSRAGLLPKTHFARDFLPN